MLSPNVHMPKTVKLTCRDCSTRSLRESVFEVFYENGRTYNRDGRTYHAIAEGSSRMLT
jgi:hypothetical protein